MATKSQHTPIAIVGTGLAGHVMALALAAKNIPCVLIGPPITAQDDERTTAIMQDGIDFLTALHVWDEQAMRAVPLKTMRLIADKTDIAFGADEIGLNQFGFNISNYMLKQRLAETIAANPQIQTIAAAATEIVWDRSVTITCDDGLSLTADLVIGADGKNSLVRQQANIPVTHTQLDQQALVCTVSAEQAHAFTSTEWYHSGGPFTLVPMRDTDNGAPCMAVVYCDAAHIIADVMQSDTDALSAYLTDLSGARFGSLDVLSAPQIWPIAPQRAHTMVGDRVALIGEAAHVLAPVGAQGFNTSLRDIQALQHVVQHAFALGLDVGQMSVLKRYNAARSLDMRTRSVGVNGLNWFIRQDNSWGRRLQAFGFQTLKHLTPLRHMLMRRTLAPVAEFAA